MMDLNEYQEIAKRTIPQDKDKKMKVAEFCVALGEEAGESVGVIKKVVFHDHPFTEDKRKKFVEELGDTLWHVAALASEYDITLDEIATTNIEKLYKRYPNGFENVRSINREV
jgi:NTP pyrophosphatase (non-canonical NTP hydrolase)